MGKKLIDMTGTKTEDMSIENRITVGMSEELMRIMALSDEAKITVIGDLEILSDAGKAYFKKYSEKLVNDEISGKYYAAMHVTKLKAMVPRTIDTNYREYIKYLRKLWRRRNELSVTNITLGDISNTVLQQLMPQVAEQAQA